MKMWTWLRKKLIIDILGGAIDHFVTKENMQSFADEILDFFERMAAKTDNEIDDAFLAGVRKALKIPDNDEA